MRTPPDAILDLPPRSRSSPRVLLVASIFVVLICLHFYTRFRQRTAMNNGRIFLRKAYTDYQMTGNLPEPKAHTTLKFFTNTITLGGTNHQSILAVDWFGSRGLLVITTNYTTLWLDNKLGPRVVDDNYRVPLFRRGI
jgi:hypothetical protein